MGDLVVLIVNWNVRDLVQTCLTSVFAELATSGIDATVWVVDNASQDGSVEMIQAEFPQVHLSVSQDNLGFAGGNNLALRQMSATVPPRYVMLLNPDTEVRFEAFDTLVGFLDRRPQVGVAGARLLHGDGAFQHGAFGFPGLWQILFDLYAMPGRFYESRLNGRYPRSWYERGEPFSIDHPLGAAMMIRWEVIHQVGLLDEGFHMYCEEIDWCMRVKRAGWDIYCVPKAEIIHHEAQSTRQIREESFINLWRSRRRLYDKHYSPIKNWLARRLVRLGMKRKARLIQNSEKRGELDAASAAAQIRAYRGALMQFE